MGHMGRPRKHDTGMPRRVYPDRGWWWFVPKDGPKVKLARLDDKAGALRAYADIMDRRPAADTVGELLARYVREVLPSKSPKTRHEQERHARKLSTVFGGMLITDLKPEHVAQYLDASRAKVQANREIALLSHALTKAVRWGLVAANPCRGIERNKEAPRTRYVTHAEFIAVIECAPPVVAAMMALAYLTGQREGDIIRLRRDALTPDGIAFQQAKTGRRLIVSWTPALAWAVEQAGKLPRGNATSLWVVCRRDGQPYTVSGFQAIWQRHIKACHERGLLAERFTFHDLRAKAGSDAKDGQLLGHMDPATLRRIYQRKPQAFAPTN